MLANFSKFDLNEHLPKDEIEKIITTLNAVLPVDYVQFIKQYNGGEGEVGSSYLVLWEFDEIVEANKDYSTDEFAPGYLIFGSDGGATAYAFERSSGDIVEFDFIGMTINDKPILISNSFTGFLEELTCN